MAIKGVNMASILGEVIGSRFKDVVFRYTRRDAILYALAIGVSTKQSDYMRFLHEAERNFTVFPTFALTPATTVVRDAILTGNFNTLSVDPSKLVLGEQYLEVFKPMTPSGKILSRGYVAEVLDKGSSGVVIATNVDTFDQDSGAKLAFGQSVFFVRQPIQSGFKRSSEKIYAVTEAPNGIPHATIQEATSVDQAALYRLAGHRDQNPLHIDPKFAQHAGYPSPLMHGVCLAGIAARHVLVAFCKNDVGRFRSIKVRFTSPVYPGDILRSDMWHLNPFRIHLQTTNLATGRVCISGYTDLHDHDKQNSNAKI